MALRVDYDQIATTYDDRYTFGLYDGVLEALRDLGVAAASMSRRKNNSAIAISPR